MRYPRERPRERIEGGELIRPDLGAVGYAPDARPKAGEGDTR
jgi:hypothetical protein